MARGCNLSPLTENHIGIKFPTISLGENRRRLDAKTDAFAPQQKQQHEHLRVDFVSQRFFPVDPISNVRHWRIFDWDHDVTVWVSERVCVYVSFESHQMRKKKANRIIIVCISMYAKKILIMSKQVVRSHFFCRWCIISSVRTGIFFAHNNYPHGRWTRKKCVCKYLVPSLCLCSVVLFSFADKSIICLHKWLKWCIFNWLSRHHWNLSFISGLFTLWLRWWCDFSGYVKNASMLYTSNKIIIY